MCNDNGEVPEFLEPLSSTQAFSSRNGGEVPEFLEPLSSTQAFSNRNGTILNCVVSGKPRKSSEKNKKTFFADFTLNSV